MHPHYGEPICDVYAHKAALAIDENVSTSPPGQTVGRYSLVQTWSDYQNVSKFDESSVLLAR